MIRIDGILAELQADDVEALAGFYERAFGFERRETRAGSATLASGAVYLSIVPRVDQAPEQPPVSLAFGPDTDLDALRDQVTAAGAIVLSESKRDGSMRLLCQDPAGNDLVLTQRPAVRALVAPESASGSEPGVEGSQIPSAPRVAPPSSGRRITRRDVDMLRDSERLASMKEAIAGLGAAFDPSDPAAIMDEMRAKIPPVDEAAAERARADAEVRAHARQKEADEMLERYRSTILGDTAPLPERPPSVVESAAPQAVTANADDDTDELAREIPRTLGRSSDGDDTTEP